MLTLTHLINNAGVSLQDFKIHCATGRIDRLTGHDNRPINAFHSGRWKVWQEHQNQENFKCQQIVSLIHLNKNRWLFAGLFKVLGVKKGNPHNPQGFNYSTEEIAGLDQLTGRVILNFEKKFRQSYLLGKKYEDQLLVAGILERRIAFRDFHGYGNVLLTFEELGIVISEQIKSWHDALSQVDGIYLITDNKSGRQYVGIAHGGEGIWQRWSVYAENGHGGNKKMEKLLKEKGFDYTKNFQFSLLEVCHLYEPEESIHQKERHWMNALRTRTFGLNT